MLIRILLLLLLPVCAGAQTVSADYPIEQMMAKWKELNRAQKTVSGWRVQLIATTDRRQMDAVLSAFKTNYPDIPIDWLHDKPYYKVQAGACPTKLEAMALQYRLKASYPAGYVVQSNSISPADLAY